MCTYHIQYEVTYPNMLGPEGVQITDNLLLYVVPTLHTGENAFVLADEQKINKRGINGTEAKLQTENRGTNIVVFIPDAGQPELKTASNVSTYSTMYQWPFFAGLQ